MHSKVLQLRKMQWMMTAASWERGREVGQECHTPSSTTITTITTGEEAAVWLGRCLLLLIGWTSAHTRRAAVQEKKAGGRVGVGLFHDVKLFKCKVLCGF